MLLSGPWIVAAVLSTPAASDHSGKLQGSLDGAWHSVIEEVVTKWAKRDIPLQITFKGQDFTWQLPSIPNLGGDFRVKIVTTKSPPHIDWLDNDGKVWFQGLYRIEDDTLRICVNLRSGKRPRAFTEDKETGDAVVVFKRGAAKKN
jgi:uncharacterized protein (TIGR03067 family)